MSFNILEMLGKARNVQQEVEKLKSQAANVVVTAESGAGMVRVRMNGNNQVLEVKLSPELISENDVEMMQDLIVAAFNNAQKEVQEKMRGELSKLSSMLPNIPGLNLG